MLGPGASLEERVKSRSRLWGLCGWCGGDSNNTASCLIKGKPGPSALSLLPLPLLSYSIPHPHYSWNIPAHSCGPRTFLFLEWKQRGAGKESEVSAGDTRCGGNGTEGLGACGGALPVWMLLTQGGG